MAPGTTCEQLGVDLARKVVASADSTPPAVTELARVVNADVNALLVELAYLEIFIVDFLVTEVLGPSTPQRRWVLNAFYGRLQQHSANWAGVLEDIHPRFAAYAHAANHPHPQYGRGYSFGKVFAMACGKSNDIALVGAGMDRFDRALKTLLPFIRSAGVVA
jgi:hypothetical protein